MEESLENAQSKTHLDHEELLKVPPVSVSPPPLIRIHDTSKSKTPSDPKEFFAKLYGPEERNTEPRKLQKEPQSYHPFSSHVHPQNNLMYVSNMPFHGNLAALCKYFFRLAQILAEHYFCFKTQIRLKLDKIQTVDRSHYEPFI